MPAEKPDQQILGLLRKADSLRVAELAGAMAVTATAVRQKLNRLMAQGLVQRKVVRDDGAGRGRPGHRYFLTAQGRRKSGGNFADLAVTLWKEIRSIRQPEVRRGLLQRIATKMAESYQPGVPGATVAQRMQGIRRLFAERDVPFTVDESGELPVLTAEACPYPELAEQDRSICAMERMLFSRLVDKDLRLTACRLDGAGCCTFETT